MAAYAKGLLGEVQQGETDAAKRTFYLDVGTAEAQVVTVSKAGAAYGATAGSTCTAVTGTEYKLVLHAGDIDTLGQLKVKSTGATDNQTCILNVVDFDPFSNGAKSSYDRKYEAGRPR